MTKDLFNQPYIPNTDDDREQMLKAISAASIDDLFLDIPESYRNPSLNIGEPLSEMEVKSKLSQMSSRNFQVPSDSSFLGAGVYRHFTPAVVPSLISRGEFLTSYTPYQPEVSQGTLQGTYEFQTMTAQIFGMEVANAGMYDGATALAEAALMACRITKRYRVAILNSVNPMYVEVVKTYTSPQGIEIYMVEDQGNDFHLDDETACLLAQYPNYWGQIGDLEEIANKVHSYGALLCASCDPIACAMFSSPGSLGVDIATGEGQALGIPPSFGGPFVGLFATKKDYLRQLPGRIVGRTVDTENRTGYVLTLQPREQHIRREKATSNICTSTALIGLWATVWTALMGKNGLRHLAELTYQKSHYAATQIDEIPGFYVISTGTFFQEFVVLCPVPSAEVNKHLENYGILGGADVSYAFPNGILFCVTEVNTREKIDLLVDALKELS